MNEFNFNLNIIIDRIIEHIIDDNNFSSIKELAETINISPAKIYSAKSNKSKMSSYSRYETLISICQGFDISPDYKNGKVKILKGFDRDKFSRKYIVVFWNKELEELKLLRIYHYAIEDDGYIGYGTFEIFDIYSGIEFESFIDFDKKGHFYNDKTKELYRFESLTIPGLTELRFEGEEYRKDEFYIGKDISDNYIGKLLLSFDEKHLQFFLENIEYFELFLSSKKMQESFSNSISTFEELLIFISDFNKLWRRFKIELPNENVSRIFQQFLSYFSEFIEKAKGRKIVFDINKNEEYLEIEILGNSVTDIDQISVYLNEYFELVNKKQENLTIEIEKEMSPIEFNFLILDLKQQINHLKQSFEVAKLKNELLKDKVNYLTNVISALKQARLPIQNNENLKQQLNRKQIFLKLISHNKIQKCIDGLLDYFNNIDDMDSIKEVIIQSSRFNENNKKARYGILNNEAHELNRNNIVAGLVNLINEEL